MQEPIPSSRQHIVNTIHRRQWIGTCEFGVARSRQSSAGLIATKPGAYISTTQVPNTEQPRGSERGRRAKHISLSYSYVGVTPDFMRNRW